jgi:hypothetical protein
MKKDVIFMRIDKILSTITFTRKQPDEGILKQDIEIPQKIIEDLEGKDVTNNKIDYNA